MKINEGNSLTRTKKTFSTRSYTNTNTSFLGNFLRRARMLLTVVHNNEGWEILAPNQGLQSLSAEHQRQYRSAYHCAAKSFGGIRNISIFDLFVSFDQYALAKIERSTLARWAIALPRGRNESQKMAK